jgi:hypothetical protein
MQESTKTYKELTGQRLSITSLLQGFNILKTYEGEYFLNILRSFNINDEVKSDANFFELYTAEENDWFDNIAYKFYGNPKLWWIIAVFNNVINPFEELLEGKQIKILKAAYHYHLFKEIASISEL